MRIILLSSIIILFSSTGLAYTRPHCDQVIYDAIYREAVQKALNASVLTESDIALKNNAIETLRQLCYGQRSTYEKKNPINKTPVKKREVHYD